MRRADVRRNRKELDGSDSIRHDSYRDHTCHSGLATVKTPLPAGWPDSRQAIVDNYRRLLAVHGDGPAATQNSAEGQLFRFERIAQVADLRGRSVLDLGCGLGDLYPFLRKRFGALDYTGIDVVPEMVKKAAAI